MLLHVPAIKSAADVLATDGPAVDAVSAADRGRSLLESNRDIETPELEGRLAALEDGT